MSESPRLVLSIHRVVTFALVLVDLLIITAAFCLGGPGAWDDHFRPASFVTWLGSAEMLGAAFLCVACCLAGLMVRMDGRDQRGRFTWLLVALGLTILSADYQFQLCERLGTLIDGAPPAWDRSAGTAAILKVIAVTAAAIMVLFSRSAMLASVPVFSSFVAGFCLVLVAVLAPAVAERAGLPGWLSPVLEGSGKLLATALFLSGSYVVLLDRMATAHAVAQVALFGERRTGQVPIGFPDRRNRVEFRPIAAPAAPRETAAASPAPEEPAGVDGEPSSATDKNHKP
jgi:hypothetical protein